MPSNDHKSGRTEPKLGDLDKLDKPSSKASGNGLPHPVRPSRGHERLRGGDSIVSRPPPSLAYRPRRHRARWIWPLIVVLVVAGLAGAWVNQNRLRALLPRTHINAMLQQAGQALQAGNLEGNNGTSAHELYARVLQQDPDNTDAIHGLRRVGQAELAHASSAAKAGHFDVARQSLASARAILGGGTDVERVTTALHKAEYSMQQAQRIISQARKALDGGDIGGAVALYRKVLALDPDNSVALHGVAQVGDVLAVRTRKALDAQDEATASKLIDTLARLVPHYSDLPALRARLTQVHQAIADAITAHLAQGNAWLDQGQLMGQGNDNALAEFNAALKLDPDNAQAKAGIEKIGHGELARAAKAVGAGDFAAAKQSIANAHKVLGDDPEIAKAKTQLDKAQSTAKQVQSDLAAAAAALKAGHIDGSDGAVAQYRKALQLDPDNSAAHAGLERAGDALATRIRAALNKNDVATASGLLDSLGQLLPHYEALPSLKAHLSQTQQTIRDTIAAHLQAASANLRQGRFTGHGGDNALNEFQAVLKLDPDNTKAHLGLQHVARALVLRANAAMDGHDVTLAGKLLDQAHALAPSLADVTLARSRLRALAAGKEPGSEQDGAPLTPADKAKVKQLVQRAASAANAGNIMLPPGGSAYDLYRAALRIDANNATARKGLADLSYKVVSLFDNALDNGRLDRASGYLVTLRSLDGGSQQVDSLTAKLVNAWLDRASASLQRGDRADAAKAVASARQLAPDSERLKALAKALGDNAS